MRIASRLLARSKTAEQHAEKADQLQHEASACVGEKKRSRIREKAQVEATLALQTQVKEDADERRAAQ